MLKAGVCFPASITTLARRTFLNRFLALEFEVLNNIVATFPTELPFGQLLLEIHAHPGVRVGSAKSHVDGEFLVAW